MSALSHFVARHETTNETFRGKVFYALHVEFDVKDKTLSDRLDGTENILASFEFHLRPSEGPDSKFLEKAQEQSN